MPKAHVLSSESPIVFSGQEEISLCGVAVPNAKAVWEFNLETGEMSPDTVNTIMFCKVCLQLALTPIGARRVLIYGIAEAQTAHDINSRFSQADGDY